MCLGRLLLGGGLFQQAGRSLAAIAARRAGVSVNAVYAPVEHRRSGYASIAVASLSRQLLDAGYAFCCLYTDLDYPASNSIYARLDCRPVQDCLDIDFARRG